MFPVALEELPLSKREKACCRRADLVNAAQILFTPPSQHPLLRRLLTPREAHHIGQVAAAAQSPAISSIFDIIGDAKTGSRTVPSEEARTAGSDSEATVQSDQAASSSKTGNGDDGAATPPLLTRLALTTGDGAMDDLLGGGVRRGCLTEIVGESSSGKTQLGVQIAVLAALGLTPLASESNDRPCSSAQLDSKGSLYGTLQGIGIQPKSAAISVAILNSGGEKTGQMMIRRLIELTDSLVEERWARGNRVDTATSAGPEERQRQAGVFQAEGKSVNSLEEAQQLAKEELLANIHLASPMDYESLEHAVSYALPALSDRLESQNKARIGLVILDDLPELLIEEGDRLSSARPDWKFRQSRMVREISIRLKRFSLSCSPSSLPSPWTSAAIVVVNQVRGAFDHDVLLPLLEQSPSNALFPAGPPPLSSTLQAGFFNGIMASVDLAAVRDARMEVAMGKGDGKTVNRLASATRKAALSDSWVNCINSRLMLVRTSQRVRVLGGNALNHDEKAVVRRAVSVLNPFARSGEGWEPCVEYVIQRNGLCALDRLSSMANDTGRDDPEQQGTGVSLDEDEEQLWTSWEADIPSADLGSLMDEQEQPHGRRGSECSDWESDKRLGDVKYEFNVV